MLSANALGAYTFGWQMASIPVDKVSGVLGQVLLPVFSTVQNDLSALRRYVRSVSEGLAIVTFPLAFGLALVADHFVLVALGTKWQAAIVPLRLLALYAGIRSLVTMFPPLLVSIGQARWSMWASVVLLLVMPVSFYVGVHWGVSGVALAWIIVYPLVAVPMLVIHTVHAIGLPLREYLRALRPAISGSVAMAAAVLVMRRLLPAGWPEVATLIALVVAGAVVYSCDAMAALRVTHPHPGGVPPFYAARSASGARGLPHPTELRSRDNVTTERELVAAVGGLYGMMLEEVATAGYSAAEASMMRDPVFYYGRFLDARTRRYAVHTLTRNLVRAVQYLGLPAPGPYKLLDVGCGLGMQSLLFGMLGAQVVGLDLRPDCIELCRKRQAYYEKALGRRLDVTFEAADFLGSRDQPAGAYDGVFSMSAFIHIQPTESTVATIARLIRSRGRVFIWDMNARSLGRIRDEYTRKLPGPREVRHSFRRHGFDVQLLAGGAAVPRQFWRWRPTDPLCRLLDGLATKVVGLSFNFVLGAVKAG